MQLKPEITSVLAALGVSEPEKDRLIEYFADRSTEAAKLVFALEANIASLQKQIDAAISLRDATLAGLHDYPVGAVAPKFQTA